MAPWRDARSQFGSSTIVRFNGTVTLTSSNFRHDPKRTSGRIVQPDAGSFNLKKVQKHIEAAARGG